MRVGEVGLALSLAGTELSIVYPVFLKLGGKVGKVLPLCNFL